MNAPTNFRFRRAAKSSSKQPGNPAAITEPVDTIVSITAVADKGVTFAGRLQDAPAGSPEQLN